MKMEKLKYKFGVIYTDGGWRDRKPLPGGGRGIHGYLFNELPAARFAKVPCLITPSGYEPKLSGAQLKDDDYNPTYGNWGYSIAVKDNPICRDGADIKILDSWESIGNETAQVAELLAAVHTLENDTFECEFYTIHSDSAYFVDGWNESLEKWAANDWRKSDNMPIANLEIWQRIKELKDVMGERVDVRKIKAHEGHHGNEFADRNASMGVAASSKGELFTDWIVTDVHDVDYWEPIKPIPPMLQQKWTYALTKTKRAATEVDGEKYTHYFMGDHNKNKDDMYLVGKFMSDGGFSLVLSKEECPIIDDVMAYHNNAMWKGVNMMYQSELVGMINLANAVKPKNVWELKRGKPECMFLSGNRKELSCAKTEDLVSAICKPPLLSYRILDIEQEFKELIYTYIVNSGKKLTGHTNITPRKICIKDVTDLFYEQTFNKNGEPGAVKLTDLYDQLAVSFNFSVNHPINDKEAKVIFTRGVDIPSRSIMNNVANKNVKVSVITWHFDGLMFKYGFVMDCDDGIGLWSGYASTRILNPEEQ